MGVADLACVLSSNIQRINALLQVGNSDADYGLSTHDALLFHAQHGLQIACTTPEPNLPFHVSFCLMKNARRCESCQAQVTPNTINCSKVHLTTLAFVLSD